VQLVPPSELFEFISRAQISFLDNAADAIESGTLEGFGPEALRRIAAALRQLADETPVKPPRKKGGEPKFSRGSARLLYLYLTTLKEPRMNHTQAIAEIGEQADVSIEAVKRAFKTHGVGPPKKKKT